VAQFQSSSSAKGAPDPGLSTGSRFYFLAQTVSEISLFFVSDIFPLISTFFRAILWGPWTPHRVESYAIRRGRSSGIEWFLIGLCSSIRGRVTPLFVHPCSPSAIYSNFCPFLPFSRPPGVRFQRSTPQKGVEFCGESNELKSEAVALLVREIIAKNREKPLFSPVFGGHCNLASPDLLAPVFFHFRVRLPLCFVL